MSKYLKNEENAAPLLEWLENGAPHTYFDINYGLISKANYGVEVGDLPDDIDSACGTVCCIAGAASQMAEGTFGDRTAFLTNDWSITQESAIEYLGIQIQHLPPQDSDWMLDIFAPEVAEEGLGQMPTGPQAAQALRNFIATGFPAWETIDV